jgi:hypothetical protein
MREDCRILKFIPVIPVGLLPFFLVLHFGWSLALTEMSPICILLGGGGGKAKILSPKPDVVVMWVALLLCV